MSRTAVIESMYADMAARHRARFRSIHVRSASDSWMKLMTADPQAGRAGEDGGPAAAVHQAARVQEPQVPAAASRAERHQEEDVHVQPPGNVLLSALGRCYGCYGFTCVAVKAPVANMKRETSLNCALKRLFSTAVRRTRRVYGQHSKRVDCIKDVKENGRQHQDSVETIQ